MDPVRLERLEALARLVVACFVGAMGRGLLSSEGRFQTARAIVEFMLATEPTTVIGLVNGLVFREKLRTRWTQCVGSA